MESSTLRAIFESTLPSTSLAMVTAVFDANVGLTPYSAIDQPNQVNNRRRLVEEMHLSRAVGDTGHNGIQHVEGDLRKHATLNLLGHGDRGVRRERRLRVACFRR